MPLPFSARLAVAVRTTRSPLCVGIDPWPERLPRLDVAGDDRPALARRALGFGRAILRACAGRVPIVKPQFAYFEALGPEGMSALARLCAEARAAGLLVLGDAKRGDIGSTAAAYAAATLHPDAPFPCDALTVNPFLGPESLDPFLAAADRHGAGLFVLLRTSNPGSETLQAPVRDTLVAWLRAEGERRRDASGLGPVGAVVGATLPKELPGLRADLPHTWLLLPGYGAQGAGPVDVRPAFRADGLGALVVAARSATFPEGDDPAWQADPEPFVRARIERIHRALAGG